MDILHVATFVFVCPLSRIIRLYIPPSRPSEYFGILAKNAKSLSACAGLLVANRGIGAEIDAKSSAPRQEKGPNVGYRPTSRVAWINALGIVSELHLTPAHFGV